MQYAPLEDILAAVAARDDEPGSYTVEYPRSISVGIGECPDHPSFGRKG